MAPPHAPSVAELLARHAAIMPDAPCLAFEDELLCYADVDERSNRLANALAALGIVAGDRVAIVAHTSPVFYELTFACSRLGAIMLPLNWRLSAREIAGILADAKPGVIIAGDAQRPLLAEGTDLPPIISLETEYPSFRDEASTTPIARAIAPEAPALLLYTSGTTGLPKGVMVSNANLAHVEAMAREAWGFTPASINLVAMPLFHIGGIGYGMMALSQGGHTVLLQAADPSSILDCIRAHAVTHAFFVPTVIHRLVEHADATGAAPASLERILYGAAPIGEGLLRRAIASFGCKFNHAYGMTETAGTVITLAPEDHDPDGPNPARLRSCGKPLPWVELALVDPATGCEVPAGEVGEIRIRSGMVMLGYWNKPVETAAAVTPAGWLCTGDAAYRDADGYVYIHDRYKDMIVSGGENIYPTELENVLADHPAVSEVAVIGVPHPRWGETPRAYVVPREGQVPTEAELINFTRERLAHYKCPTSVVLAEALPRNASGKILKRDLRDLDRQRETAGTRA
jgi:acyl-CoA synthetase (AMP-forming)/AMP-acid ligase II